MPIAEAVPVRTEPFRPTGRLTLESLGSQVLDSNPGSTPCRLCGAGRTLLTLSELTCERGAGTLCLGVDGEPGRCECGVPGPRGLDKWRLSECGCFSSAGV